MAVTRADLFASPDHYLHSFDGDAAIFVPMDRAAYHRSIFLDARISPAAEGTMRLPVALVNGGVVRSPGATSWIFHVAHCGSTLLARALDDEKSNLVLREPLALRQAALMPDAARLALVAAMLGKRYRADLPTLVKANVPVNFVLPQLAAVTPGARALFLYLPLRDYLLAILRSDEHRGWLNRVAGQLALPGHDMPLTDDAERAAALWSAQIGHFAVAIDAMPGAGSLDAERFFCAPAESLTAAAGHLAVPLSPADVAARVSGPLFSSYSKDPGKPFDNAARLARRHALERTLSDEIDRAERWIDRHRPDARSALATLARAAITD